MHFTRALERAAVVLALLGSAGAAQARSAGVAALGCDGCHSGGTAPKVTLTAAPSPAGVGEPITLTISISQANGPSAGFYLTTKFDNLGAFKATDAGTVVDSSGVFHTTPRAGSGGSTVFTAQWTATKPTGVAFDVFALSANGDRTNRGDGAGAAQLQLVVGCSGRTFYIDQDGDGFGSIDPAYASRQECEAPPGYAAQPGDCDDFRSQVYPGAPEQCDLRDNDCDGEVDDNVVSQLFCEDKDGDGHGVMGRATVMDCKPIAGFGACDGDCDDGDALFFPGAPEVCDLRDNNCNGETDEGARRLCGVGLCARKASGCSQTDCTPGEPLPETCNGYDDDCDGVVDNEDSSVLLCDSPGARCVAGQCVQGAGGGPGGIAGGAGAAASGAPPAGAAGAVREGACAVANGASAGLWGAALGIAGLLLLQRRRVAPASNARRP